MPAKKKNAKTQKEPRGRFPKATEKASKDKNNKPHAEELNFPVVGVGTSAGGLMAFEDFFKHMPPDTGMAFVVAAHLDLTHSMVLHELIQKYTEMQVQLVKDGMVVQPDCVYVIPPNKSLAIAQNTLRLFPKEEADGSRMPIDSFFRSLAEDRGRNAVAVVLSGAGADGAMGIRAIKGEGGMVMVQDATTAKYDSMPLSAIATGAADYILPPEKMAEHLGAYARRNLGNGAVKPLSRDGDLTAMRRIFTQLRARTGHDFSQYKQNTIRRRITRRMAVYRIENIAAYAAYMEQNPQEVKLLFKELLIGVTNFFRDPEAFGILKERIIKKMLADRPENSQFRIWVPGCSTGEEAYSIAIIMQELMDELHKGFQAQVFGTDIDSQAVETARLGIYPVSIASDVGAERLKSHFTRLENSYRIKKEIREMAVFAAQDIIKDPPFIKMDLISCRNLLIYLEADLQKRLIPIFHYGLKPDGILFLGYSETVDGCSDLFSAVDKKYKLFKREGAPAANQAFYDAFGVDRNQAKRKPFLEVDCFKSLLPDLKGALDRVVASREALEKYKIAFDEKSRGRRSFLLNARPVAQGPKETFKILLAFEEPRNES